MVPSTEYDARMKSRRSYRYRPRRHDRPSVGGALLGTFTALASPLVILYALENMPRWDSSSLRADFPSSAISKANASTPDADGNFQDYASVIKNGASLVSPAKW